MVQQAMPNAGTDTQSAPARVRVSLREIRECVFRALSAHGASPGEAATAAAMVVDAELQGHRGIHVVLRDLERGRWEQGAVQIADPGSEAQARVVLGDPTGNRPLRHLPLGAHLAAAEPGRDVYVPGDMADSACLDVVLLEVAQATERPVALVQVPQGRRTEFRVALADGSLGHGRAEGLAEWGAEDIGTAVDHGCAADGVWLFVPATPSAQASPDLTWVSAPARAQARASAARAGRLITAEPWWALYEASRRYLVAS